MKSKESQNPQPNHYPIRNPWEMIDYASARGQEHREEHVEILQHYDLIDCGLGDSPFGSPEELPRILERISSNGALTEAMWKYPADRFCERPAQRVRERFRLSERPTISFHGEGSYGLLAKIILELPDVTREEEVGVLGIGPQFPNIVGLAEKHGWDEEGNPNFPYRSITPDLHLPYDQKIDLLIENRDNNHNGRRFIYIDNPNNPTGDAASPSSVERLVRVSQENGDVVIVDEAYGDILPDKQSAIKLTETYDNLIVVRGMAKVIGLAGIRVGYAVMSPKIGDIYKSLELWSLELMVRNNS